MDDLEYLLEQLNNWYYGKRVKLNIAYRPLFNLIRRGKIYKDIPFEEKALEPIEYHAERKQPILLYSGGKCSTALALNIKNHNPMLYYIGEESDWTKEFCDSISLDHRSLNEVVNYDNPLSIIYIIGRALNYAVYYKFSPIIYVGTFEMSSICNNPFSMWCNCSEIIGTFEQVIKKVLPNFKILTPLPSYSYVWDILMQNKGYIKYIQCSTETDRMIFEIAKDDYDIEECKNYLLYIEKLRKMYFNEIKYKVGMKDFWQRYFFYDIRRSTHYDEMKKLFGE